MEGTTKIWDFRIVSYLFLAGMGAGAYGSVVFIGLWTGIPESLRLTAAVLGFILVMAGILFLVADLGHPMRFIKVFRNPSSVITYGSLILSLFLLAAFIDVISPALRSFTGEIAIILISLGVAGYTGFLLGVVNARPFWNTPILPIVFLVSAISTGLSGLTLVWLMISGANGLLFAEQIKDSKEMILVLELILIITYLFVMKSGVMEATRSVKLIISGALKNTFWFGVVGLGLVLPTLIMLLLTGFWSVVLSSILVISGGYSLRHVILRAGGRVLLPGEDWRFGIS